MITLDIDHISPHQLISDRTRRDRRTLLLVSVIGIMVSLLNRYPTTIAALGMSLEEADRTIFLWSLLLSVLFFFSTFIARLSADIRNVIVKFDEVKEINPFYADSVFDGYINSLKDVRILLTTLLRAEYHNMKIPLKHERPEMILEKSRNYNPYDEAAQLERLEKDLKIVWVGRARRSFLTPVFILDVWFPVVVSVISTFLLVSRIFE